MIQQAAYYNENDNFAADWLERLIEAGHLPPGRVDRRGIEEVRAEDLDGHDQCHFFAGIGGWALALSLVGWEPTTPVWTGSCPCQPFSQAGRRRGERDPRHLFPVWYSLIEKCRPPVVFGEQVASPLGRNWLAAVRLEMEALGYGVGGADLCAAGVGAPHIRQRLWWVGEPNGQSAGRNGRTGARAQAQGGERGQAARGERDAPGSPGGDSGLGHTQHARPHEEQQPRGAEKEGRMLESQGSSSWAPCEWLPCSDGKARPVEPGTFPLAHGIPARVGRLRGYGNAIVPEVAAEFIGAYLETC